MAKPQSSSFHNSTANVLGADAAAMTRGDLTLSQSQPAGCSRQTPRQGLSAVTAHDATDIASAESSPSLTANAPDDASETASAVEAEGNVVEDKQATHVSTKSEASGSDGGCGGERAWQSPQLNVINLADASVDGTCGSPHDFGGTDSASTTRGGENCDHGNITSLPAQAEEDGEQDNAGTKPVVPPTQLTSRQNGTGCRSSSRRWQRKRPLMLWLSSISRNSVTLRTDPEGPADIAASPHDEQSRCPLSSANEGGVGTKDKVANRYSVPDDDGDVVIVANALAVPEEVYATDIRPYVPDEVVAEEKRRKFRKRLVFFSVLASCIVVPIAAVVTVVVEREPEVGDYSWYEDTGDYSWYEDTGESRRFVHIGNYLAKIGVTAGDDIRAVRTPQNRALRWISDEDEMYANVSDPTFVQRYVSAVFYYAMNGEGWSRCYRGDNDTHCGGTPWLSESPECTWYGVGCDESSMVRDLYIEGLNLTGHLPSEMAQLVGLRYMSLSKNKLTGSIPEWINKLDNLETLWLGGNEMDSDLPESLFHLPKLEVLALNGNKFTGEISSKVGHLTRLWTLDLGSNSFVSSLPSSVCDMATLRLLRLHNNDMNGTMPDGLYQIKALEEVSFGGNQFSGSISAAVGQLTDMIVFDVQGNKFSGIIPENFGSMLRLEQLFLSGNDFSGSMPKSICALNLLDLSCDCGGRFSKVQCEIDCCTECISC